MKLITSVSVTEHLAFVLSAPSSVDWISLFWDIDSRIKTGNLDTTLLYVCEYILFGVQN